MLMLSINLSEIVESQDALLFLKAGTGNSSSNDFSSTLFYLDGESDFLSIFVSDFT